MLYYGDYSYIRGYGDILLVITPTPTFGILVRGLSSGFRLAKVSDC